MLGYPGKMIEASPITIRRGETARHLDLKELAVNWAFQQGFALVAPEVAFPHWRFRVDVAACAPARKAPSRVQVSSVSSVLKAAVVFECKQGRGDLIRDNKRRQLLTERVNTLEARRIRLESLLQLHLPHLSNGKAFSPSSTVTAYANIAMRVTPSSFANLGFRNAERLMGPSLTA